MKRIKREEDKLFDYIQKQFKTNGSNLNIAIEIDSNRQRLMQFDDISFRIMMLRDYG